MTESALVTYLDEHPEIRWDDPDQAAQTVANLLDTVQSDRSALRELVVRAQHEPKLSTMCEADEFRTKFVLYDALDRGFRLRMHLWRDDFSDTPHQHRFGYVTRLLSGSYEHVIYGANQPITLPGQDEYYDELLPLDHPFVAGRIQPDLFDRVLSFTAVAGEHYFQSSDIDLSSTNIRSNTVSLFVRSPAVREASFQWHRDKSAIVWRAGIAKVSEEQRSSVLVSAEHLEAAVAKLDALGIFTN